MRRRLVLAVALLIVVITVWRVLFAPSDPGSTSRVTVEVPSGTGARGIAQRLADAGVLRSRLGFVLLVLARGARGELHAGTYEISPRESPARIIDRLINGDTLPADITVTFPEGFTLAQMAERLAAKGVVERSAFLEAATVEKFQQDFSFLRDAPEDAPLEGYLFPDTYRWFPGTSAPDVLRRMLTRFGEQWERANEGVGSRESGVGTPRPDTQHPTPNTHAIVTLASIVEREVRSPEDRRLVAGILWKRFVAGIGLDADATIRYALGNWDDPLTVEDLRVDSPYNTRRFRGLPPGPIGNPGMDSLRAAFAPTVSDNLYYLSAPDGTTIFSRTLDEHTAARRKYLPQGEFTGR